MPGDLTTRTGYVRVRGPAPPDWPKDKVAVGYIRASDWELVEDHFTFPTQLRLVGRAAADLEGVWLTGYYWDIIGAADPDRPRPGYARCLGAAEVGKFGLLLLSRRDRFGRDALENGLGRRRLREADVKVYIADTRSYMAVGGGAIQDFVEHVLDGIPMLDRGLRLEQMLEGRRTAHGQGRHATGVAPYGYRIRRCTRAEGLGKTLEVVQPQAQVVYAIFAMLAAGASQAYVTRRLNAMGVPTAAGGKLWYQMSVSIILRNPVYLGMVQYDGHVQRGIHPPLVSEQLFLRALGNVAARRKGNSARVKMPTLPT